MIVTVEQLNRKDEYILPFNQRILTPSRVWRNGVPIASTSAEITIQSIEISGEELLDGSAVIFDLSNTLRNTSASNCTYRYRVYVQGTIVYDDTSPNLSSAAGLIAQLMSIRCLIDAKSWSIFTYGLVIHGGRGAVTAGVAGDMATAVAVPTTPFIGNPVNYRQGDALTIRVSVQMSVSNANAEFVNVFNQLQIITG